jgi:hypothetical protein
VDIHPQNDAMAARGATYVIAVNTPPNTTNTYDLTVISASAPSHLALQLDKPVTVSLRPDQFMYLRIPIDATRESKVSYTRVFFLSFCTKIDGDVVCYVVLLCVHWGEL